MMQPECGRIQWGRVTTQTQTQVRYALNHLIGQMQIWPTKIGTLAKLTRNPVGVFQLNSALPFVRDIIAFIY